MRVPTHFKEITKINEHMVNYVKHLPEKCPSCRREINFSYESIRDFERGNVFECHCCYVFVKDLRK